jgi:hypothetical protein
MIAMRALVLLLLVPGTSGYTPKGPRFSWDTLPVFFHSSNASGPVNAEALKFMAKFPMVTIEKFQGPCGHKHPTPDCNQEAQIINVLKGVKALNPNVSTVFYYNSVLDFPQYKLHGIMLEEAKKDPSVLLHDATGSLVKMHGPGAVCDVFDFSNSRTRELFIQECINATQSGYVDGCFADRSVGGIDKGIKLTEEKAAAYAAGHVKVLTDLQTALGEGPLIANHAYGPPHDPMQPGSVDFAMMEFFYANNASIQSLLLSSANGRGVQAHGQRSRDALAAFLIGAGYRAFYGVGDWLTSHSNFDDHWMTEFELPLGAPLADAIYSPANGGIWTRRFEHVNVTFALKGSKGTIQGWSPSPAPTPSPTPSPSPLPKPTQQCPQIVHGGYMHDDLGKTTSATWSLCCNDCARTPNCTHWTLGLANKPSYCHLHGPTASHSTDITSGRISGTVARQVSWLVV